MINQYGGSMPDAIGIPEEELRKAAKLAVCKINIDSDIRLAMTATIRKYFAEHPDHFDPRQYLKPARQAVKDMVTHKLITFWAATARRKRLHAQFNNFADKDTLVFQGVFRFFYAFPLSVKSASGGGCVPALPALGTAHRLRSAAY